MKSAFLATMSHELRTPLNSIIGFTGIVLQELAGPLNPEQAKQLGMVRSSARHLLALINDVLDISKIEAGQLEVRREPVELRAAIEQVLATVGPLAADKGLALEAEFDDDLGAVTADRRRVEQILLNLLSNAVKFTDRGSVRLVTECVDGDRAVRVRVVDTGIGIAPDDLGQLFQPFRQLDSGMTRQHEGTGLGLAICRRLATLMGGTITASSTLGVGSEFVVEFPRRGGVGAEPLTFERPTPHPTPTGAIS
jgi:signal transduction histidine kinase